MGTLVILIICALVLYTLSQGAPYVPTQSKNAVKALELMDLPKNIIIVDVGAGDGAVLKTAAENGYRAIGIEINPLLWLVARARTRKFGRKVKVIYGNAFRWHLPAGTAGVFLFTAGPFADKMNVWLRAEQKRLNRPLIVVSLAFHLPREKVVMSAGACIKYVLK